MSDFRFETSERGDEHVVRLFGDFDITGFKQVDEELARIQADGRPTVRARALGRRLQLTAGPERVHKVFQITRLDDQLAFVHPED
jgi:hypothetical protein